MQHIVDGADITPLLASGVHFRSDTVDTLGADQVNAHVHGRTTGAFQKFVPGQVVMKRNLIFAWWQIEGLDGLEQQGTWILSFDRDGQVVEWQEFKG